jgi:TonB family protein
MPAATLANFILYLLHVAALVAVGIGLPRLFGLPARARLLHYRVVLVLALALPLVPPVALPAAAPLPAGAGGMGLITPALSLSTLTLPSPAAVAIGSWLSGAARWAGPLVLAAVLAGLGMRLAWLAGRFRRLRRLRRRAARLAPRPAAVADAVALVGADADIRLSPDISAPVNFGARRPTVLLPTTVRAYPDEEQRAIACHELIHVRRHDWLRILGDEILRALFWFHPAIWWLLDEIHLAREEVVDQEVVEITGNRRPYLEALVKLARPAARPALRPAASILGRAKLERRVALLLEEVQMSKTRLVTVLAVSVSGLVAAAAFAVWTLPLEAASRGTGAPGAPSIASPAVGGVAATFATQEKPGGEALPRLRPEQTKVLSRVEPVFTPEAKASGAKGVVIVEATIDTAGRVTAAKVLRSRGAAVDNAVLEAVRQWTFEPPERESAVVLTVRFDPEPRDPPEHRLRPEQTKVLSRVEPVYTPEGRASGVRGVVILEVRLDPAGNVTDAKVLRSRGAAVDRAIVEAVRQWKFEPRGREGTAVVTVRFDPGSGL